MGVAGGEAKAPVGAAESAAREEARFYGALAKALRGGPRNAAEMMLKGPTYPSGIGDVSALDAVAAARGTYSALAAYDAAYLLRMVPPTDADARFWLDLEQRFRSAARQLDGEEMQRRATEAADAARDTAKAIEAAGKQREATAR